MARTGMIGSEPVLAIHGGAGTINRSQMTPAKEAAYRDGLTAALVAGRDLLAAGASAVDAVAEAVRVLEECPLFNAGRGSVFTSDGRVELDAAIMDGATRAAGAVAGVSRIRNPVLAARLVMQRSPHVLLIGTGAEAFAEAQGLEIVDPSFFHTQERRAQLEAARAANRVMLDHDGAAATARGQGTATEDKHGTVGAVARDRDGNLAAATSTGGVTNKQWGRVGDSPIIGAGTYADNQSVAISATGLGEAFIRAVAAHEVAALMKYKGFSLDQAVTEVATVTVRANGGTGGLIGVDASGNVAMRFSTGGMYRGHVRGAEMPQVAIYRD